MGNWVPPLPVVAGAAGTGDGKAEDGPAPLPVPPAGSNVGRGRHRVPSIRRTPGRRGMAGCNEPEPGLSFRPGQWLGY